MIIRVYALYSRSARVLWFLIATAVCAVGLTVVCVLAFLPLKKAPIMLQWSVTGQQASRSWILGGCHFGLTESTYVTTIP
jgi:hypothetical protein